MFEMFFLHPSLALANSPINVVIAKWDSTNQCVLFAYGFYNVDTVARDGLAGEWFSTDPKQALRAGADLIRSDAVFFSTHPEWTDPIAGQNCAGVDQFYFDMRNSRFEGWGPGKGALDKGIANHIPNNQVTNTGGEVVAQNGTAKYYEFNSCLQGQTVTLANQGYFHDKIIIDPTVGVYRQNNGCVPAHSSLSISYGYYAFSPSLTNGLGIFYAQGDSPPFSNHTVPPDGVYSPSEITSEGASRQGEHYWGFIHLDTANTDVDHPPPAEPGIYVRGPSRGDKGEYQMAFGGSHQNTIRVSGIDDHPAPVTVNIYVDGIYQFSMSWINGDDARTQISQVLGTSGQFTAGTHEVAIEFSNDYYHPDICTNGGLSLDQCDRNMYLDNFLITTP
jgi:hypothetical protein